MTNLKWIFYGMILLILGCTSPNVGEVDEGNASIPQNVTIDFSDSTIFLSKGESFPFKVEIPQLGRYRVAVLCSQNSDSSELWIEDYVNNQDERTYDVTGKIRIPKGELQGEKDGSPFNVGVHQMRIHVTQGKVQLKQINFQLMKADQKTPNSYTQNMEDGEWSLVWSDEFDGQGLPDSNNWTYNIGNWGWGNNELQYYTQNDTLNARQENGNLIIESHYSESNNTWTSARLTSQGKNSFLYGKIEFRAKVPAARGTWAAGWLLGDDYQDEISWPYCGEIDVLECVGFEINDTTGNGINHATCHTPSYYFKKGNQIGSEIAMNQMDSEFHVYAVEWYPHEIRGLVDGVHYYTYDKNANELEWPFNKPQNLIINLAIGGGWGGAKGIDSSYLSHQYILDYVRVYEKVQGGEK